ncbi:histidinol-phosphate transaminase [Gluconobacter wancherniae]|uniref:histidinol-phosphate transaminase n=1 Tax=Gluconobacter wancherniae TaxID=1307955 RepID=UPI002013AB54|nr:histidinol-phosphate transaminase [Gluconobacter wancherniae]
MLSDAASAGKVRVLTCRPEIAELPLYNAGLSTEAVRARYGVSEVTKLGSNENPYGPSPSVSMALGNIVSRLPLYPEADQLLKAEISRYLGAISGQIILGNGSEQIIRMIAEAYVSPGDRVVTVIPSFGLHIITAEAMGGIVEAVPVTQDCEFDLDALHKAVSKPLKLLIFANPSNPVGCMMTGQQLKDLVGSCPPDCLIVVDEAYREYAEHDPSYPSARAILAAQQRPWMVLRTFSKAFGLAGLRIGYGITSDSAVADAIGKVRDPFNTNIVAQIAGCAALNDLPHMENTVYATVEERESLRNALVEMGLKIAPSCANFLFFETSISSGNLAEALLHEGVIIKPWKEPGYTSWSRVSIGTPEENARFLAALRTVLHPSSVREAQEA